MTEAKNFLPYGRQTITEADIAEVVEVLRSPYLTQGPAIQAFEQKVASKVGAKHGVACNSATSALHLGCMALGLGEGDYLWTTPITFVASANCGRYCGANIDFVDIDPKTGLMSIPKLAKKLEEAELKGKLPKIVVPVHLCGTSCEMATINKLSKQYGFAILEDASHAIGGSYGNKPVGSCAYSSICVFSFHPVKIITTGEGGLAVTNDPQLAERMTELRSHGITKNPERFERTAPGAWSYEQQSLGYNYRMTDIQAKLGLNQLKRLDSIVTERRQLLANYQVLLKNLPLKLLEIPSNVSSSVHLAVIQLNDPFRQKEVFDGLRKRGIGVQVHYTPVHLQPYYRRLGFKEDQYPEAENYARKSISIPLYPGLKEQDQKRVVEALTTLLGQ